MTTVQNLLCMRQHDPVLAAVWDAEHIEQVEVLWEEDLALEGRRLLHDTGALKDVMQNHMLQLLSLLAMELPAGPSEREPRDAKVAAQPAARLAEARRARRVRAARPLRGRAHRPPRGARLRRRGGR